MHKLILLISIFFISLSISAGTPKKKIPAKRVTSSIKKVQPTKPSYALNKVGEPIDLGLSVMWSSMEIGAKDSLSMGAEFQWGCVAPNNKGNKKNYKFYNPESFNYTKYFDYGDNENDKSKHLVDSTAKSLSFILDVEDDAAKKLWGNGWRLPTRNELKELCNDCNWELIKEQGKRGYRVTGSNGNSIFVTLTEPLERYYWSSCSVYDYNNRDEGNESAWGLLMNSYNYFTVELYRYGGNWIRPVKDFEQKTPTE